MGGGGNPPERGVKMFELAQTNIFTPKRKKGGGNHWRFVPHCWQGLGLGGVEWVGKASVWTPTWSALLDFGGFSPEAANRGVYAGAVHGIATRPKPKPKPAASRRWRPPAAAAPQPRGRLRQGTGGHLPRPGPPRHGMSIAF